MIHSIDTFSDIFIEDKYNPEPNYAVKVMIVRIMDGICEILQDMGAKFYESVEDCERAACLKAWDNKTMDYVGTYSLVQSRRLYPTTLQL